jgi:predicted nuclease of predicted toxin-antitoxin system
MIKFISDENISPALIKAIRKRGFNVKDIKEDGMFGTSDDEILKVANKENRIVISHDKDFANLINNRQLPHKGVILLRFIDQSPNNAIKHFIPLLDSKTKDRFKNNLVVVSEGFVKIE